MILQGVKNFFMNLKYIFVPMGTVALGLVFGLSVLIPGALSSASVLVDSVAEILEGTPIDLDALLSSVTDSAGELEWSDPVTAVQTMFSDDWLTAALTRAVGALVGDVGAYTSELGAAAGVFAGAMGSYLSTLVIFVFLGFLLGYFLLKIFIRRNMARRAFWKYLLISLTDSLITASLVAGSVYLLSLWQPSVFISTPVSLLLFGFISLLEAYIVHGLGKVEFRRVVNFKNILQLIATNLLIFAAAAAMVALLTALTNTFVGIFVGVSLLEIAFIVVGMNAEAYVKSFAALVASAPDSNPEFDTDRHGFLND